MVQDWEMPSFPSALFSLSTLLEKVFSDVEIKPEILLEQDRRYRVLAMIFLSIDFRFQFQHYVFASLVLTWNSQLNVSKMFLKTPTRYQLQLVQRNHWTDWRDLHQRQYVLRRWWFSIWSRVVICLLAGCSRIWKFCYCFSWQNQFSFCHVISSQQL